MASVSHELAPLADPLPLATTAPRTAAATAPVGGQSYRGKTAIDAGLSLEGPPSAESIRPVPQTRDELARDPTALRPEAPPPIEQPPLLRAELLDWIKENLPWYSISFAIHMTALAALTIVVARMDVWQKTQRSEEFFPAARDDWTGQEHLAPNPLDPPQLEQPKLLVVDDDWRTLAGQKTASSDKSDSRPEGGGLPGVASPLGGDGFGFNYSGPGGGHVIHTGLGADSGFSNKPGRGGAGDGFGGRGPRKGMGIGRTKETDLAVTMALDWFHRHRNQNGSWSLAHYLAHCKGAPCGSPGAAESDAAATALSILPILGAGETHVGRGMYHDDVKSGLYWIMHHQTAAGDLSAGCDKPMYAHALATLAMCEAYGMTHDEKLRDAAQRAVIYVEMAQVPATGGWRYTPRDATGGDTSVLGWQMMSLRAAQLAGLSVNTMIMDNAKKWLARVSKGHDHGLYCYQPFKEATPTMTAIGMLSWQYLGMRADDPAMIEGKYYLMQNLPDNGKRSTYYWYYGTQVMHNFGADPKWDHWNRNMRRALVETQCREGCAAGSWDPESPTLDEWSEQGGRVVTTAFSTLSLEVYYRYLPIYRTGSSPNDPPADIGNTDDVVAP